MLSCEVAVILALEVQAIGVLAQIIDALDGVALGEVLITLQGRQPVDEAP